MFVGFFLIVMVYFGEEIEIGIFGLVMGLYISGNVIGVVFGRIVLGFLSEYFIWYVVMGLIGVISLIVSIIFFMNLFLFRYFMLRKLEFG